VVYVTDRAHIDMRLCAFEFFLGHSATPIPDYCFLITASAILAGTSEYLENSIL
jgi:hypothetical protein